MNDVQGLVEKLLGEDKLTMPAAGRLVGDRQGGPPVHASTITRWALKGVKVGGRVVRLEYLRAGGKILTTRQAMVRFLAAQIEVEVADVAPAPRTPTQRKRAADAAGEELARMGI